MARDNSAANVLIDRIGMENVNAMLDSLGLAHTRLRRKMMDLEAAKHVPQRSSRQKEAEISARGSGLHFRHHPVLVRAQVAL